MSHEIYGNRAAFREEPAWHNLGVVFNGQVSATNALQLADADIIIDKLPLEVTMKIIDDNGEEKSIRIIDNNKYALIRRPDKIDSNPSGVLGVVSGNYQVLQNRRIAEIFDGLSEQYPVETCGVLKDGASFFMSLKDKTPSFVGKDEIINYLILSSNNDGLKSTRLIYSPVRVVCQNTLTLSQTQASVNVTFPHDKNIEEDIEFYSNLILSVTKTQEKTLAIFREMLNTKATKSDLTRMVNVAYPLPTKPKRLDIVDEKLLEQLVKKGVKNADSQLDRYNIALAKYESDIERQANIQELAFTLHEKFCDEFPNAAWTGWSLYNAATENSDWREPGRKYSENGLEYSVLFGPRADEKRRAYGFIVKELL